MFEKEIKLTAQSASTLDAVKVSPIVLNSLDGTFHQRIEDIEARRFLAAYYDSVDQVLNHNRCSLRSRLEGDHWKAAFKLKGRIEQGLSVRQEFECPVDGWLDGVDDLPEGELKDHVLRYLEPDTPLIQRVTMDMSRTIVNLRLGQTRVEMVLDSGIIKGATQAVELNEVELELKSGDIEQVMGLSEKLMESFPLIHSTQTKHAIGLSLS